MESKKKRILFVSDPLSLVTGLAYVAGSFAKYFDKKPDQYELGYYTLRGVFEDKIRAVDLSEKQLDNLKIFTSKEVNNPNLIFNNFTKVISEFNPHIVITVADPWDLEVVAFNELRYSYCWVAYTTIEVSDVYSDRVFNDSSVVKRNFKSIYDILSKADLIIPVTQMGKNVLKNLEVNGNYLNNICEENVYNGLDIEQRLEQKISKEKVFQGFLKNDDFVFISLGVNSERKKIDQVILAFHQFMLRLAKERDHNINKVKLYLHTNLHSAPGGPDLMAVINECKLYDSVLGMAQNSFATKKQIYELYRACDVYIGLPGGEGFGYGFAEAMLNELPVIYINYGGHVEFAKYGGLPVKVRDKIYAVKLGMKWALPDLKDASQQMYKLYKNSHLRKELGKQGSEFVINNLSWDKIGDQLERIIIDYYEKNEAQNLYGMKFKRIG